MCGLTFELSGRRRQDARPGLAKMYRVPPDRAWWPAVGAPLERRVRRHWPHDCVRAFGYVFDLATKGSTLSCSAASFLATTARAGSVARLRGCVARRAHPEE